MLWLTINIGGWHEGIRSVSGCEFTSEFANTYLHVWMIIIWLVVWNICYVSIYWECHHPNWPIFFRGVAQPPTSHNIEKSKKKIGWWFHAESLYIIYFIYIYIHRQLWRRTASHAQGADSFLRRQGLGSQLFCLKVAVSGHGGCPWMNCFKAHNSNKKHRKAKSYHKIVEKMLFYLFIFYLFAGSLSCIVSLFHQTLKPLTWWLVQAA